MSDREIDEAEGSPRSRRDRVSQGLPRESRRRGKEPRGPAVWNTHEVVVFGQYPKGFVRWAARFMGVAEGDIAHICAGALSPESGRITVDNRLKVRPAVVADGRQLPFSDNCFEAVLIDPPYTALYSRDLYNGTYPRPSHLLREASRVVKPNGLVGMLHFLIPRPEASLTLERVKAISLGCGYQIRAFTLFRECGPDLFEATSEIAL